MREDSRTEEMGHDQLNGDGELAFSEGLQLMVKLASELKLVCFYSFGRIRIKAKKRQGQS